MKDIKIHHIHFIGICGVAMSALAIAMQKAGYKVTGSDKGFFPPVSTHLIKHKINFYPGWHVDKMTHSTSSWPAGKGDPDLVVVGNVAGSKNPEWQYVQEKKLKYVSYPGLLKEFYIKKNSIVCAGTYGKTTTSSLLSYILKQVEFEPSYMFGGLCVDENFLSAEINDGDWSVMEGDEYKTARWDMSPKFSHYSPTHLLLTGLQWDHADIYPTEKEYFAAFDKLFKSIPEGGLIVMSENINNLQSPVSGLKTYGKKQNADYKYYDINQTKQGITFKIHNKNKTYQIQSDMLGEYMAENITGCFAMAREIGIPAESIVENIKKFPGLKRRLEKRYSGSIDIYDDIAHSPAKASFTLENLRKIYNKKIIAVFEPNTGNRQVESAPSYKNAFKNADEVIIPRLTKIKKDPTKPEPYDGENLTEVISETHKNTKHIEGDNELVEYIYKSTTSGDVVVFLGSHGFRGMIDELIAKY
ncbi:MAG: hypothetical protein GF349_02300 [Candidatus Magasanikbacteria bacterium]|nr:hypothetical protein [Candidatus Magasanikbacteria bacterium]